MNFRDYFVQKKRRSITEFKFSCDDKGVKLEYCTQGFKCYNYNKEANKTVIPNKTAALWNFRPKYD